MNPEHMPQNVPQVEQSVAITMKEVAAEIEKRNEEKKRVEADATMPPAIKENFLKRIETEINELTERGINSLGSTKVIRSQEELDRKYAVEEEDLFSKAMDNAPDEGTRYAK